MSQLTILHRAKNQKGSADACLPLHTVNSVWSTCLREIAFSDEITQFPSDPVKGLELHREAEALVFLLEVLCGLRSPVLGETEIMAQFKSYLETIPADHPLHRDPSLLPFLHNTVKLTRTTLLSSTGSLSYGQIVRRWLKTVPNVALWGFGSLGSEIYPWIKEKTSAVLVRQARIAGSEVPFLVGGESPEVAAHLIAAPLSDEVVQKLAEKAFVIDLRDGSVSGPQTKSLADLFEEIQSLRRVQENLIPQCQEFLRLKVEAYLARHQIRPFGWEDLCG